MAHDNLIPVAGVSILGLDGSRRVAICQQRTPRRCENQRARGRPPTACSASSEGAPKEEADHRVGWRLETLNVLSQLRGALDGGIDFHALLLQGLEGGR